VIKNEFRGIEQRPQDVFNRLLPPGLIAWVFAKRSGRQHEFLLERESTVRREV
jgi:hypothetical protein